MRCSLMINQQSVRGGTKPLAEGELGSCADSLNVLTSDWRTVQQTLTTHCPDTLLTTGDLHHPATTHRHLHNSTLRLTVV